MIIRSEQPVDYDEIYTLVKTAFSTAPVSDGDEQDYVNTLRAGGGYINKLALVAEKSHRLIGHIMLTEVPVLQGEHTDILLLVAPLCVALEYRNQNIGSMLMAEGLARAGRLGYKGAVLCGDPDYYSRFGFKEAASFGITSSMDIPAKYILALPLAPDGLEGVSGIVTIQ